MARIISFGEPVNDCERQVIAHLRDNGPDSWTVLHNVELPSRQQQFEIDLIVLTPHTVHVIDVKGTRGRVAVAGNRWYPQRRAPFRSPLPKLRSHAKTLKTLLTGGTPRLGRLYVGALVVLCDPTAELHDPENRDVEDVCRTDGLIPMLADTSRVPPDFDAHGGIGSDPHLLASLEGSARPPSGPRGFGNWEVVERLSESDDLSEYRARNRSLPTGSPECVIARLSARPVPARGRPSTAAAAGRERLRHAWAAPRSPEHCQLPGLFHR